MPPCSPVGWGLTPPEGGGARAGRHASAHSWKTRFSMDLTDGLRRDFDEAARVMLRARHTVAFIGAGMSAESGIPTFRGPGGLWTKKGEPDPRGYATFLADPKAWWENRLHPTDADM